MLVLSTLNSLLAQLVTSRTSLHTSILLTPQGHLVAYASDALPSDDRVRILVGISSEVWRECIEGDHDSDYEDETSSAGGFAGTGGDKCREGDQDEERRMEAALWDEEEVGMLECEFGRILVFPIYSTSSGDPATKVHTSNSIPNNTRLYGLPPLKTPHATSHKQPVLLLALNATEDVPWGLIHTKARALGRYLTAQLSVVGDRLSPGSSPPTGPKHRIVGWGR